MANILTKGKLKMKFNLLTGMLITILFSACASYTNIPKLNSMSEFSYRTEVKYIQLANQINLAYSDEGTGTETIVFIHGLGSYMPAWDKNIPELSKKYRCIAIDLPGYGKSSKNPHSGLMSFYANVVAEFIERMDLKQVTLAGHSMGGQISMITALAYPQLVKNLILAAPAGFEAFHPGQKQWFKDVMSVNLVKLTPYDAIETNLASNFYNMPPTARFMITDRAAMRSASDFDNYCYAVSKSVGGMVDEPVIDKLDKINQPTLIIFGENDNLIPNRYLNPGRTVEIAKNGASKIKNSQLIMIPKAGHFVMFEAYETYNAEVLKFLK
ncbi:MAG TPA: alpha/beta hydrolase [Bacteroidales bacterium]|nr:alpha/beta hydrolase [Bacteroidales bacterium]